MKQVVVTGAAGYIGRALVRALAQSVTRVYAVVRAAAPAQVAFAGLNNVTVLEAGSPLRLPGADILYHLAWEGMRPEYRGDTELQLKNVELSLGYMRAAHAAGIGRVVLVGSAMEYAYCQQPINGSCAPSPLNAYGAAKLAARYLCETYAARQGMAFLPTVVTSVYGPGRRDSNVIFYTIDTLLRGEKPSLSGLEQKWDYIHIDDLTRALLLVGKRGRSGTLYPIGSGENRPLRDYIALIRDIIDPALPLGIGEIPYASGRIPSSCIDLGPLAGDTGFAPQIPFEAGIRELIAHYRKEDGYGV